MECFCDWTLLCLQIFHTNRHCEHHSDLTIMGIAFLSPLHLYSHILSYIKTCIVFTHAVFVHAIKEQITQNIGLGLKMLKNVVETKIYYQGFLFKSTPESQSSRLSPMKSNKTYLFFYAPTIQLWSGTPRQFNFPWSEWTCKEKWSLSSALPLCEETACLFSA